MLTRSTLTMLFAAGAILLAAVATISLTLSAGEKPTNDAHMMKEKQMDQMKDKTAMQAAMIDTTALNPLTAEERRVIVNKGTEMPFSGEYYNHRKAGTYICRHCNAPLYRSEDKFDSGCGWPSFDDAIAGAVHRSLDADGSRTEITCTHCGAHLGHVFEGEGFTPKNERACVNSISLRFIPKGEAMPVALGDKMTANGATTVMTSAPGMDKNHSMGTTTDVKAETTYVAGGCFWGVEHLLKHEPGVIATTVGYMNGKTKNPSYKDVCSHTTGHAEAVQIVFDPAKTNFENVAKAFFEIHDPTQMNRQGNDIGDQYRSAVFFTNDAQKATTEKLIGILKGKGLKVVTEVTKADQFYPAEAYHQDYYDVTGGTPYCHFRVKRF